MTSDSKILENLNELDDYSEASITQAIHERFINNLKHTKVSNVLVAVNDFSKFNANLEEKNLIINEVAQKALNRISDLSSTHETIILSGESGSGKSFNAFRILKYFSSQKNSKVNLKQIESIQTILKSFGCSKTLKNDEATRYGCSIDLLYSRSNLCGLNLKCTVPLEVTRVCSQKTGERNYNIFYEIYHGLSDDAKNKFGIRELQKFFYINQGNLSENVQNDEDNFDGLDKALDTLAFSEDHRLSIYRIIATILHIGNIYFRAKRIQNIETEIIEIGNVSEVKWIAYLLEINYDDLVDILLQKSSNGQSINSLNSALDNRDSLAMLLYDELFKWILTRISIHFKCPNNTGTITIIDNYGFEKYNNNGLEEFLINSVHEKLENLFVKKMFHDQMVDFVKDGLTINYKTSSSIENGKVVDLIFKKPYGLLPLLTDECKFPRGTNETYLEHCNLNHMDKNVYGKPRSKDKLEFGIRHSVGTSWYSLHDFLRKNKRVVPGNMIKALCSSKNSILTMLFQALDARENNDLVLSQAQMVIKGVSDIAEKIKTSHCNYIRCIRSNNERSEKKFDIPMINRQVKSLLLSDLLQFRNKTYPIKYLKRDFAREFRCLLPGDIAMCQNEKEIILDILQGQGVKFENDYKIGNEFIFLRERLADRYQNQQSKICHNSAIIIQKNLKTFMAKKEFQKKRNAIIKLQAGLRGWRARRDYMIEREEMFKVLGRTTKRNKRLAAYHEALECLSDKPEQTTLVGYIDIDEDAKKVLQRPKSDNSFEATQTVTKYLTVPIKNFLPNMKSISLEEYADENFKGHLLEPRREPIMTPFLHKESEVDFRLSVEIFKLVLKFMNDQKLSSAQRNDLGRFIVYQGISNPCQRDEIIVQIINQIHKNPNKIAVDNGWKLIHMAISVFPPTENIIPMLIGVFNQQPNALREQLFATLQRRLKIYDSEIARELPPSNLELHATPASANTIAEVNCFDGLTYDVHINSWMTANEVAERVLKQRGVGIPIGWTVEVETPKRVFAPTGTHFVHDIFAQVDGVEESRKSSVVFNFPPEKLVKKTNLKTETVADEKIQKLEATPNVVTREYPTPEEWMKQPASAKTTTSIIGKKERPFASDVLEKLSEGNSSEAEKESLNREFNEQAAYSYTLPKKNKNKSSSPVKQENNSSDEDPAYEPVRQTESINYQIPQIENDSTHFHDSSQIIKSPVLSRKSYARPDPDKYVPINFAPPPTFTYPQQMPMMQYVPIMVPQPMMTGQPMAMIPQPVLMQPQYSYAPQYTQIPHYPAPELRNEIFSPINDRLINGNESIRSRGHPENSENRFRRGEIPSQYSTIRNMPVPEHHGDVEQFLDAVFDQVLSRDEHRAAEVNAKQLAGTIKGGRGMSGQPNSEIIDYPQGYRQYEISPNRYRARSLPRHVISPINMNNDHIYDQYEQRPHSRHSFSEESTSSDEMEYQNRARSRERSLPRYNPSNGAPYSNPNTESKGPVYMMMPVQVNENGEMILLSPIESEGLMPNSATSRSILSEKPRRKPRGVEKYLAKRSPSVDGYLAKPPMIRRTPDGIERIQMRSNIVQSPAGRQGKRVEDYRTLPRSESRSRERMEPPILTRQLPPRLDYAYNNGNGRLPKVNYRSPSPNSTPVAQERKGLNRLPIDTYIEPVVKSTTNNGEYLNPHRFNTEHEKAVIRAEKEKSREALNKLNQQLRKLPPPIDNVRLIRPRTAIQPIRNPSPSPPPPPPPPRVPTPQPARHISPQPAPKVLQNTWSIHDVVERDPSRQEREKEDIFIPKTVSIEKPGVKLIKAPWKLTIRKEMFYPGEVLNDIQLIDQIFAQIVEDCKKSYPYRIRLQDRIQVEDVLRAYQVPPEDLNNQSRILPDVKVEVIEKARQWPLYFNQIYEVIEKRSDESIEILLAISEHGIRLLLHTPHEIENPLSIQDHFPFETIVDVSLEANDILTIHISHENDHEAYTAIRLKTNQATQIKKTIEKCVSGRAVEKRKLVRALEDYVTNEQNHLSFKRGDVIELLPSPEGEIPPSGDWLYGRIDNRFGYLLSQYVDSKHSESVPPLRFESSLDKDNHVKMFDDNIQVSGERYTILDFATKYFRRPKENKRNEEWTWSDIAQAVKFTNKQISHSLLKDLNNEEDKHAVETFLSIRKFMGDEALKKSESITDVVFKILIICHRHPNLKDEVYCQIIKQITSNTSEKMDSAIRGWRLLSIITAYFSSSLTFKPYILQFLFENADDVQRQYHGVAKICQFNLLQTFKYGGRKVLLSALEVQQTTDGKTIRRQPFFLAREHSVIENVKPVTVAEEMIQELCNLLSVRSLSEQQEFSLGYTIGKDKRIHYCKNDEYLMDIITELEHRKLNFEFYLKRTVWVHPLRFDNIEYIDSMFDQTIDDYLRGSIVSTTENGQLTAVTTEEIMKLAAFLFLLSSNNSDRVTIKHLPFIVPRTAIEQKTRKQELMVARINNEVQYWERKYQGAVSLKRHFLEIISSWPLFGVSSYRLRTIAENGHLLPEVILTIDKQGVKLLQPKSQAVFKQWNFDQIISVESIKKTSFKQLKMVIGIIGSETVLDIKTEEADEIAHLIGQYIYVVNDRATRISTEL